ncbi:YesL family protein [Clostridium sp. DL1XJH146]
MKEFFGVDSAFFSIGTAVFDIILLNILWFVFSIPIFTIGASTTALYSVTGKMVRKEGYYVIADFWKSFKENFKQGTIIGVASLLLLLLLIFNIRTMYDMAGKINWIVIIQVFLLINLVLINIYIYPLVSRFHITIKNAIKTSFVLWIKYALVTLASVALLLVGSFILYIAPIFIMVSVSLYAYITSLMMQKIFKKIQEASEENKVDKEQ